MKASDCRFPRDEITAFADGELRGSRVLGVLRHLDRCDACADEVEALRGLGDVLRRAVSKTDVAPSELAGLAGTVVSRARAEAAQSWTSVLRRACEDWHWAIVGSGALVATLVSTLALSAILAFGPKPDRDDSISAYYTNFRMSAGQLYVVATPVGHDHNPVVFEVNDRGTLRANVEHAAWYPERRSEAALVDALQQVVMADGYVIGIDEMSPERRRETLSLLEEINHFRTASPWPDNIEFAVRQVRLVASTSVTVKGL